MSLDDAGEMRLREELAALRAANEQLRADEARWAARLCLLEERLADIHEICEGR